MSRSRRFTALDMAKELQARGYLVKVVKRTEGSIRITQIGGNKFKGSLGNAEARKILGIELSEAQSRHLAKIKQTAHKFGKKKKEALDPKWIKLQEKINREFKKQDKTARVRRSTIRYHLKEFGPEGVEDYLKRAYRYVKKFAMTENLYALLKRIELDRETYRGTKLIHYFNEIIEKLSDIVKRELLVERDDYEEMLSITYDMELGDEVLPVPDWHKFMIPLLAKAKELL